MKRFLKWFGVRFPPTSTVIWFLPTMRKGLHAQSQIWHNFCREGEEEEDPLSLGGFAIFIDPYDHYLI